jgi:hypothetical protein
MPGVGIVGVSPVGRQRIAQPLGQLPMRLLRSITYPGRRGHRRCCSRGRGRCAGRQRHPWVARSSKDPPRHGAAPHPESDRVWAMLTHSHSGHPARVRALRQALGDGCQTPASLPTQAPPRPRSPRPHTPPYPRHMTQRLEFDVDEMTAAYLHRCAHQCGVSIGAVAARQLRELALVDAARALAA